MLIYSNEEIHIKKLRQNIVNKCSIFIYVFSRVFFSHKKTWSKLVLEFPNATVAIRKLLCDINSIMVYSTLCTVRKV